MKEKIQQQLFAPEEIEPNWRDEWKGMPEFNMEDKAPAHQLIVNFLSKEDLQAFAKLLGQKITYRTKSIFFPYKARKPSKIYIHES